MKSNDSDKLLPIRIDGTAHRVPSNDVLLAAIQYLVRDEVPVLGRFCWSDECGNCELSLRRRDELLPTRVRACQTQVEPEMELSDLTPDLSYWLQRLGRG